MTIAIQIRLLAERLGLSPDYSDCELTELGAAIRDGHDDADIEVRNVRRALVPGVSADRSAPELSVAELRKYLDA